MMHLMNQAIAFGIGGFNAGLMGESVIGAVSCRD